MSRRLPFVIVMLAAWLLGGSTVSAGTLREAMQTLAHDVSRTLRRLSDGPVLLMGVDGPFNDAAAPLVGREFVLALEASGVKTSKRPTPITVGLEYARDEEPGRFTAVARIRSADNRLLRDVEATFVLDDAVDRAVLEGLSYDATTSSDGEPRIATRSVVQSALSEGTVQVVAEAVPAVEAPGIAEPAAATRAQLPEQVLIEVQPDGRVIVTTGGTRIVVEPSPNRPDTVERTLDDDRRGRAVKPSKLSQPTGPRKRAKSARESGNSNRESSPRRGGNRREANPSPDPTTLPRRSRKQIAVPTAEHPLRGPARGRS